MSATASSADSHGNNHAHAKVVPAYPPGIVDLLLNLCNQICLHQQVCLFSKKAHLFARNTLPTAKILKLLKTKSFCIVKIFTS